MNPTAALQRFIEEELAHMPALIEQVRRQTADTLRDAPQGSATAAERMQRFELAKALDAQGQRFAEAFVAALGQRARADGAAPAAAPAALRDLTLLDESTHNADIEIARVATRIDSVAEWELRELQTFTSALCGLPYVSVSANPFAPEAFAHALWKAAGAVCRTPDAVALLRAASAPLADAVRHALAAACSRLEAQGVQPSLYRSAVPARGESTPSSLLAGLRDGAAASQAARVDAQTRGLLKDLFDAIAQGSQMHPALRALTASLQAPALDLAARDAQLLESAAHPLWKLLDRFGYQSATHPDAVDPQLRAWVGYATELVAAVQRTPLPDAQSYAECVKQLDAYSAAQFNAQLQQAAGDIAALEQGAPVAAAIDLGTMQTVPAELLAAHAADADDADAAAWLDAQPPGAWYRIFLRGRWCVMRLLWRNAARTRWLFASPHPQRNDGFERATLVRLRAEKLIRPFVERAIIVRAAESVRRRIADKRTTR